MTATNKPHLKLVNGQPVPTTALGVARMKFGRPFAHESDTNFLRHPEPVLTRWGKRASYYNLNPHMPVPAWAVCHFQERK